MAAMAADFSDILNSSLQHGILKEVGDILNKSSPPQDWSPALKTHGSTLDNVLLIFAYAVLSVTAMFGNSLVCYVILKNRRLHTPTNFFIANLAVSDLLVTCLNVPFNIMWHVLYDWPFGEVLCHLMNFSLMVSVYVSTYTLTAIALDRHHVVLKPLSCRMSKSLAVLLLVLIWVLAVLLSLPYGIYTKVERRQIVLKQDKDAVIHCVRRCRYDYPSPSARFGQCLTVATIVVQYCVPLTLIGVAYGRIVQSLWSRTHVGAVTALQQQCQSRAKRKSIKLLIAVVVVFALCWLPLNLYHLLTDLHPNPELFKYNSKAFFACHWVAISSTCYNPFVYCWLNENFRNEVKRRFRWFKRGGSHARCLKRRESKTQTQGSTPESRPSCRASSACTNSTRRAELTFLSDPDDLHHLCHKPADLLDVGPERKGEEGTSLLSLHRNGRVEFHVTHLHKCVNN